MPSKEFTLSFLASKRVRRLKALPSHNMAALGAKCDKWSLGHKSAMNSNRLVYSLMSVSPGRKVGIICHGRCDNDDEDSCPLEDGAPSPSGILDLRFPLSSWQVNSVIAGSSATNVDWGFPNHTLVATGLLRPPQQSSLPLQRSPALSCLFHLASGPATSNEGRPRPTMHRRMRSKPPDLRRRFERHAEQASGVGSHFANHTPNKV